MSSHGPVHHQQQHQPYYCAAMSASNQASWESLAAEAKLAIASALDFHFASAAPQLEHAPVVPSNTDAQQVTDNVRQLLSEPKTTSLPSSPPSSLNARRRKTTPDSSRDTVTYTPATHRISKAKKGKRVHACQFPGCSKVFTRAEHRRRHELNHNPQASFVCKVEGCGKGFHRSDLLARHLEKHDLDTRTPNSPRNGHQRRGSQTTTTSTTPTLFDSMGVMSSPLPSPTPPHLSSSSSLPADTQTAAHPNYESYEHDFSLPLWTGAGGSLDQVTGSVDGIYSYPDDIPPYLSPDRSVSPSSDGNPCQLPVQAHAAAQTPDSLSGSSLIDSPPLDVSFPDWQPLDPNIQSSDLFPINYDVDNLQAMYQLQYPSADWTDMNGLPPDATLPPGPEQYLGMTEWK